MAKQKKLKKNRPTAKLSVRTRTKSMMASIADFMTPLYTVYGDFCRETTLHGLKHTVEPKLHYLERLLWFVLTVAAFTGAVYCALSQLSRYNSDPVVVSLQRDYRSWHTTFPAVTVCYIERLDETNARKVIETTWNVTEDSDPVRYQFYHDFLVLISDVSFRDNLQNFWKYQNDESVSGIDLLELTLKVHPKNEFKVVKSQSKEEVHWYPVMTEVGMCHTFNSVFAQYQYMVKDVDFVPKDLLQCHYHSGQCYITINSIDTAARYFIHSPYEISTAISNPTGEVQPGEEMIIDFKAVEIQASSSVKELRIDQRRCRFPDEWLGESIKTYSFALCQMHCRTRLALMFCGCRPYFHVKGGTLTTLFQTNMNATGGGGLVPAAATLRINMLPPKFRLHRDVIFTLEDLFELSVFAHPCTSLGGTTALFVGASALTVIETGLFLIRHIVDYIHDKITERYFRINFNP